MALVGSDAAHFRLLAEVRWQVFRNSLNAGFKKLEAVVRVLTWIIGASTVAICSLLFAMAGYFVFIGKPFVIGILLWMLFLLWQLMPLLLEGSVPALDFRDLARYPIRFRLFYLMSVAYGLLDPAAMTCATWLMSLGVGIILRSPRSALPVVVFFGLFGLCNLLLNRIVFGWLRRITATRRNREILVAVGVLLLLVFQFSFWTLVPKLENGDGKKRIAPVIRAVHANSPMGIASAAVSQPRKNGLLALGVLGGTCGVFGLLLYRQLRPMYLGEMQSESVVRSGAIQVEPGWEFPFAGPQLSAMVEREVRYFFRESRLWVNQISIWTFVLIAAMAPTFGSIRTPPC